MTSHETQSTYSNSTGTKASLSSGQNNLKKLKSKHASKLSTLKELFENWTDEDLLFAIQDADGDLELTIERISAGHAVQWGEVKSKKSKKEAAKAKAAQPTTPLPSANPPRTQASRNNTERGRVPRGGATPRKTRGKPTNSQQPLQSQAASWGKQTKPIQSTERVTGGSWASIASALKTAQPTNDTATESWNSASATENWPATNPSSDTNWSVKPSWGEEPANITPSERNETSTKSPILTATSSSATTSSAPKTWASLLKSKPAPKPEPKPVVQEEKPANDAWDAPINTSENDNWNAPTEDNWNAPTEDGWNAASAATENNDPWTQTEQQNSLEPPETKEDVRDDIKRGPESPSKITESLGSTELSNGAPAHVEAIEDKEQTRSAQASPPTTAITTDAKVRQPIGRRVRPEEPVVLPNSNASLAGVDVKFGSLNLDDVTPGVIEANSRLNEHDKKPDQIQVSDKQASTIEPQQNYLNRYAGNAPTAVGQNAGLTTTEPLADTASYLKQQQVQAQQQQQAYHAQQHSQQQHLGMDHLTSAYNTYLPNQPPTGASGYGINPMGSVPDYGVYGAEAQRAAMGYFDPNTFDHHSPSVTSATAYQMRDKYNQDSGNPAGTQSNTQAQGMPQQQVYPNMPYYQYYYVPNHFNTYQQSAYGQPFLNKNMYQMYQTSGKPNNASANSQYAATQQAQHLYNQSLSGSGGPAGYDEMTSLQHQLGAGGNMGINDYQKPSTYGAGSQIQGFLNNFSGPAQQGAQQAQTAPNSASGQGQGKPDANNGPYKPSVPQQPQQQAYQQAMPTPSNYFSHHQPQQMFYPQQVQQYPMQQHMDNTQQQGRQQQYWAQ